MRMPISKNGFWEVVKLIEQISLKIIALVCEITRLSRLPDVSSERISRIRLQLLGELKRQISELEVMVAND